VLHDTANGGTTLTPGPSERQGTTDKFFHGDWLGSTRYLSDSTGNNTPNALRFDGYGRLSDFEGGTTHPTEFQWAGGWDTQRGSGAARASRGWGWTPSSSAPTTRRWGAS
jgi:hypothetical protein